MNVAAKMGPLMEFDWQAYLRRIGFEGVVEVDHAGLTELHRRQVRSIAFENFDILLGRPITLDPTRLWEKMVDNRRGGYCFELNGLMVMAMQAFGFHARPLLAHVHMSGEVNPLRTHQFSLVTLDGEDWLSDVGFGSSSPRAPVRFALDQPQQQDGECFRIIASTDYGYMLQSQLEGDWQDLYSFDLDTVDPQDIYKGNQFASTHPHSFFTHTGVAAIQSESGRMALRNLDLRVVEGGNETLQSVAPGADYIKMLDDCFGLQIDRPFDALNLPDEAQQ